MIPCPHPDCDHHAANNVTLRAHLDEDNTLHTGPIGRDSYRVLPSRARGPYQHTGPQPLTIGEQVSMGISICQVGLMWIDDEKGNAWATIRQRYAELGVTFLMNLIWTSATTLRSFGVTPPPIVAVFPKEGTPEALEFNAKLAVSELLDYAGGGIVNLGAAEQNVFGLVLQDFAWTDATIERMLDLFADLPTEAVRAKLERMIDNATRRGGVLPQDVVLPMADERGGRRG